MAGKTFINNTNYDLSVQLTVRKGANSGSEAGIVNFSLRHGNSSYVPYGDSDDPYLDGIAVNAVGGGNIIASQEFVITRGSTIDNDFNTNNCVNFGMKEDSIVLAFSNG